MASKLFCRVFKLKSISKAGLKLTAGRPGETKGSGDDRLQTDDLLINDVGIEGGKIIGTDESKLLRTKEIPDELGTGNTIKGLKTVEQVKAEKSIETKDKTQDLDNLLAKTEKLENEEKPFERNEFTASFNSPFSNEDKTQPRDNFESTVYKTNIDEIITKTPEQDLEVSTKIVEHEPKKHFGFIDSANLSKPIATTEANEANIPKTDLLNQNQNLKKSTEVENVKIAEPTKLELSNNSPVASANKPPKNPDNLHNTEAVSSFSSDYEPFDYQKNLQKKEVSKKPITDFNPSFEDPTPDRKLNIGRTDQEKKEPPSAKSYFFEKTESEEKTPFEPNGDVPKKASGKYERLGTTKKISQSGVSMPDLVTSQKESSDKQYFNTLQSIMNARSADKHGNMFHPGRLTESTRNKPFPIDAMDPRALPSYTPALSEKPFLPKDFFKFAEPSSISSYDLVPGPTILRTLGNIWKYVPIMGTQFVASLIYTLQTLITAYDRKLKHPTIYPYYYLLNKYGPMVRLHGPIGGDILIMAVNGQSFPIIHIKTRGSKRQSLFDCLNIYRRDATPLTYMLNIPKVSNVPDNPTLKIDQYYSVIEKITDNFVKRKKFVRSFAESKKDDLHGNELTKWAMQCTMEVYFKSKVNYLDKTEIEASKILENFAKVTESLRLCETGIQLWRLFSTFAWLDMTENCKHLDRFIAYEVNQCINSSKKEENSSVVELLLGTEDLPANDFLTPLLDLLIIDVNMAASMAGFLLYHLGKSPQAQRTLFRELSSVLPKGGGSISQSDLSKLKYLNACIIETLRLIPPFPILSRQLEEDTKIHRFNIPRGTFIQMVNVLPCARGDICYEDIGRFQAERWTDKSTTLGGDPLMGLPQWQSFPKFNRDLIVTQVALLVAKVVREYRIEYPTADIYSDGMVLQSSTIPFNFVFIERVV